MRHAGRVPTSQRLHDFKATCPQPRLALAGAGVTLVAPRRDLVLLVVASQLTARDQLPPPRPPRAQRVGAETPGGLHAVQEGPAQRGALPARTARAAARCGAGLPLAVPSEIKAVFHTGSSLSPPRTHHHPECPLPLAVSSLSVGSTRSTEPPRTQTGPPGCQSAGDPCA